jgi:hypothetical protein
VFLLKTLVCLVLDLYLVALASLSAVPPPGAPVQVNVPVIHYPKTGAYSFDAVVTNRTNPWSRHYTQGFVERKDVSGFVAVRYADRFRLGQVAVVSLYDPRTRQYGRPIRLEVADYQKAADATSYQRLEVDGYTADRFGFYGWCAQYIRRVCVDWRGEGRSKAIIIRWER